MVKLDPRTGLSYRIMMNYDKIIILETNPGKTHESIYKSTALKDNEALLFSDSLLPPLDPNG